MLLDLSTGWKRGLGADKPSELEDELWAVSLQAVERKVRGEKPGYVTSDEIVAIFKAERTR